MEQKATEDDYETRLLRLQEEEESIKRQRKERKKQKQLETEKANQAAEADIDPEMAALMGFSGFGGGK
eukprot:2956174-Pyramimonas_sp.AAC.1